MRLLSTKTLLYFLLALTTVMAISLVPGTVAAQGLTPPPDTSENFKCAEGSTTQECVDANPITAWLQFFINLLSVVILGGAVVMIAYSGLQYTTSRDSPQAVQAAKQKIWNVVIGLLVYFFLYSFVQWLVPGGVF